MARNVSRQKIQEYVMDLAQGIGQRLLRELPAETRLVLEKQPHPKIEGKTNYDYVSWLCLQGYHKKATTVINEALESNAQPVSH